MISTLKVHSTFLGKFLGAVWILFATFITFEITARVDDWIHYDAPLLGNYDFERLFRVTDQGVRGVPHGRYLRWRLNGDGRIGPESLKDAGQTRVIVYGASEAFGMYEDAGKNFPRVLNMILNSQSTVGAFEVINAGIPGMSIGSGISYLRELHIQLHPKVVVIYPTPTHYIGVVRPHCGREQMIVAHDPSFFPELRVVNKIKELVKRMLPMRAMSWLRKGAIAWQLRGRNKIEDSGETSVKAFEVDLRCALEEIRTLGMVPILATHANRFGEVARHDDKYWLIAWRQQHPEMDEENFLKFERRANEVIRMIAEQEKVPLADAAIALGGHIDFFADYAHFSNEGAATMAALLSPVVIKLLTNPSEHLTTKTSR